jgi:cytochrome c oxidase assembly protein subunit 15
MYENTATVQFQHRVLGISTAVGAVGLATAGLTAASTSSAAKMALLTPQARVGLMAVGASALGQVTLGIVTLLQYVPITLAAAHQIGSIVVFTSSMYLAHSLRYAQPALKRLAATASTNVSGTAASSSASATSAAAVKSGKTVVESVTRRA